jgi:hypothetical protein
MAGGACGPYGSYLVHGDRHGVLVIESFPLAHPVHQRPQVGPRRLELAIAQICPQAFFDHPALALLTSSGDDLGCSQDVLVYCILGRAGVGAG